MQNEWKDDLVSTMRVYSVACDDAIDLELSEVEAYAGTIVTPEGGEPLVLTMGSRNPELIKELPGHALRAAVVKPLSMAIAVGLDDIPTANGRALQAFRFGCLSVENVPVRGASLGPTGEAQIGSVVKTWSAEDLDRLQSEVGRHYMYEIGGFIFERSLQGKARGGVPLYTPQHFLAPVLRKIVLLHAARKSGSSETHSSDTPLGASTPSSGENSDAPGDAHAESLPTSPAE